MEIENKQRQKYAKGEVFEIKNKQQVLKIFLVHLLQLVFTLIAVFFLNITAALFLSFLALFGCTYITYRIFSDTKPEKPKTDEQPVIPVCEIEQEKSNMQKSTDNEPTVVIHGYEPSAGVSETDTDDGETQLTKNVYTAKDEEFITNFIILGKDKEAIRVLSECFDRVGSDVGDEMVNYLVTNLIRTFVKLVANIKTDKKDSKYKFENMLSLVRLNTVEEMKEAVCELAVGLCSEMKQIRDDKEESLSKRVQEYVEENFSDRELDVSTISDFLGLSPSYATRLFKQETGEVLSYYINRVRVEKARELLRLGLYRIEQIAHMVGYLDSRALSRAFKRFYGVTPSQYKEMSYIETNTGI